MAQGLVALVSTSLLSEAITLSTSQFLALWAETIFVIVIGFLIVVSAVLIGSNDDFNVMVGEAVGAVSSLVGAILILVLLNTNIGLTYTQVTNPLNYSPQLATFNEFLLLGSIITLFLGLPLALVGSLRHFESKTAANPAMQ